MTAIIDHYQTLGVIPSAEAAVIKAAYRALVSIYHPDRNPDANAADKIKDINAAYFILSEPEKRKEYDKGRESVQHNASSSEFDQTGAFTTDPLEKDWAIAVSFYPNIKREYEDLEKISWRLAFAFKLQLLEDQKYQSTSQIAEKLKADYLMLYFGKNKEVIAYAEQLIKSREIQAALYLNKIINVMGGSVDDWDVKDKLNHKYPGIQKRLHARSLYLQIKNDPYDYSLVRQLVELHSGTVKEKFFGTIVLWLNDQEYKFNHVVDFRKFVLTHYAEKYA